MVKFSLPKIAQATFVQILQTLVNISPNWPEKQLTLFWLGFFMYVKRLGGGKITLPSV